MSDVGRLPGPVAQRWDWQYAAACRDADPRLFFAAENERGGARRLRETAARRFCGSCPVTRQCLEHAVTVREPYGIWAGLSESQLQRAYAAAQQPAG